MQVKAAVLYQMGLDAPYAQTQPLHIETLELDAPQVGEVLVEVVSAGLCHSDLSVIDASRPRVMPMVLGHEAAGIVREVGAGVSEFAPGDHVVFSFVPACGRCVYCATGRAALCENGAKANTAGSLLSGGRRFHNPGGEGKPAQRMLVAIASSGQDLWFFKLTGPAQAVDEQRAAFDEFLKSLEFDEGHAVDR